MLLSCIHPVNFCFYLSWSDQDQTKLPTIKRYKTDQKGETTICRYQMMFVHGIQNRV